MPEEGKKFVVGDWSAIEGRVLPWLANSRGSEKVLEVFRAGQDIYLHTAAAMGIDSRQIGKVATLALGFQGGVNAFQSMARNYALIITDEQAQHVVDTWRGSNSWAVVFWRKLDTAASDAVKYPNTWRKAGRIRYIFTPHMLDGTLLCVLPDDSTIQYPKARLELVDTPWGEKKPAVTYAKAGILPSAGEDEWPRQTLYAGLACENATQAVAAVLLRDALYECDTYGDELPVVLHVHDEIVVEVPDGEEDYALTNLQRVMEYTPAWAEGLPLEAKPKITLRYGK
jgi:DNA polymerase